jgi:lipopolysaccharide/colanic/teichoic acid biosynthesis glycosyltransferase
VAIAPSRSRYDAAKRAVDVSLGLVLFVLFLPLMLLVAIAVRLNSPGPVLFKQRRLGRDMRPFTVLKFRTMAVDSSPELHQQYIAELVNSDPGATANGNGNGQVKKLTADPRVTGVGRILRRVSLDELPQLFNVIRGSMSLVGPRPALEYELEHYRAEHFERFNVRPGVTGLWQVSGRNSLGFREMLDLDVEYAQEATLATDLRILARTPVAAVRHAA